MAPDPAVRRVLLLEDSQADAELIVERLRLGEDPYDVTVVQMEPEFHEALGTSPPFDVILSDHNLTRFNSLLALALARRHLPDTPFIVVSGTIGEEAAIDAMKAGATDYVLKSRLTRLLPTVERAITEARERRERAEAERALRRSEERYRSFLDTTTDWVWAADLDGCLTFVNRAATTMTGRDAAELLGRRFVDFTAPEDVEAVGAAHAQSASGQPSTSAIRHAWRHHDGTRRVFETTMTPAFELRRSEISGDRREIVGSRGITRDVTARLQLEEQFRQAQRMEAIGTLAGGIAHDFNNALTSILGFSELLLQDVDSLDPRHADLTAIQKAAEHSASLTRQLLAFSRRQRLEPVLLDLRSVITDVEKLLRRVIGENITLDVDPAISLPMVRADRGQLEQVLMNLTVNARDAMADGGRLSIGVRAVELNGRDLPEASPGTYVLLTVRDTGAGMDPAVVARVFEPFFTTKPAGKGTGLGLSTVYGIVKQSGGHVAIDSKPGVGTTFSVFLPAAEIAGAERTVASFDSDHQLDGSETILLVEDEAAVREFVRRSLVARGYRVIEAESAEEARAKFGSGEPVDLLLTDTVLPGESGPELAAALQAMQPTLRVLFTSGYTDQSAVREKLMARSNGFLQKPFGPSVLARKVREALR